MFAERVRNLILAMMLGLLASRGGGGGGGGNPAPLQRTLGLTINGLPSGLAANMAAIGPGLEIIRIAHPTYTNHFGGMVAFGRSGAMAMESCCSSLPTVRCPGLCGQISIATARR